MRSGVAVVPVMLHVGLGTFRPVKEDSIRDHIMHTEFCADTGICDFDLSIFEEQPDGSYLRSDEHQQERCYTMEAITAALRNAGMELLGVFSDWQFAAPDDTTERWYFCARAIK